MQGVAGQWSGVRFNPRAREEREWRIIFIGTKAGSFNPRAREEREHIGISARVFVARFNPRAREEREG